MLCLLLGVAALAALARLAWEIAQGKELNSILFDTIGEMLIAPGATAQQEQIALAARKKMIEKRLIKDHTL